MKRTNFIALDVHSAFCEGGYIDDAGREKAAWHEPTAIPELIKVIEAVPRPRKLVTTILLSEHSHLPLLPNLITKFGSSIGHPKFTKKSHLRREGSGIELSTASHIVILSPAFRGDPNCFESSLHRRISRVISDSFILQGHTLATTS